MKVKIAELGGMKCSKCGNQMRKIRRLGEIKYKCRCGRIVKITGNDSVFSLLYSRIKSIMKKVGML